MPTDCHNQERGAAPDAEHSHLAGHPDRGRGGGFWRSRAGLTAAVFLAVAAFLLLSEHRAHALGALPYLLILACPLMHLFMHHGHGGHGGHSDRGPDPNQPSRGG